MVSFQITTADAALGELELSDMAHALSVFVSTQFMGDLIHCSSERADKVVTLREQNLP